MMCITCSKLNFHFTIKYCLSCKNQINISLASLCNKCSETQKKCEICLKNLQTSPLNKLKYSCGTCGNKTR